MTRALILLVLLATLAGCSSGGSGELRGTSSASTPLDLQSATVTDGILQAFTVHSRSASPIPAGDWTLQLAGTSGGKATNLTLHTPGPAIAVNATARISVSAAGQPDWQDGTDLAINATAPNGDAGSLTIRTV